MTSDCLSGNAITGDRSGDNDRVDTSDFESRFLRVTLSRNSGPLPVHLVQFRNTSSELIFA